MFSNKISKKLYFYASVKDINKRNPSQAESDEKGAITHIAPYRTICIAHHHFNTLESKKDNNKKYVLTNNLYMNRKSPLGFQHR